MLVGRRFPLAVLVSLGLHLLAGVLIVGSSLLNALPTVPIDVEIQGMRLEDLHDLPLGAPAPPSPPAAAAPSIPSQIDERDAAKASRDRLRERERQRAVADAADVDRRTPKPTSVRSYGPEGSRVTALLRIDRLRSTPYAAPVDALLLHLPDRRDLLEGTGIDLYRDIDALLIATPNPLDARVTLLAARHRLSDGALRAALERGARATGRKLTWRTERGRPFAERRSAAAAAAAAGGAAARTAVPTDSEAQTTRDQRLILLAAPGLVVVTPPAYRKLILGDRAGAPVPPPAGAHRDQTPDAGAPHPGPDAGIAPVPVDDGSGWALLLRRIDAEDSILPADAVAMVSASDLFRARSLGTTLDIAPGTRGAVDDDPPLKVKATVMGLPVPRLLTATLGITPQPFADVEVQFTSDSEAVRWEQEWPQLRHKLLTNPLVVLSGFSGLIGRATVGREASALHLHIDTTELETIRILEIAASQLTAIGR